MFRKRINKEYPPGTFIPTPARVAVMIQLCLAFSLLIWEASQPFMGDLFRIKSQMLLYQEVMGINSLSNLTLEQKGRLDRNAERFAKMPETVRKEIEKNYTLLKEQQDVSFSQKMEKLLKLFTHQLSPYELTWIFFSVAISIMLLKRIEGARQAAWLLPVLTLLFFLETQMHGVDAYKEESQLFPSEEEIQHEYLKESMSPNILKQQEQLLRGWNLYLITKWAQENPSDDPPIFQFQVEKGLFLFNVAHLGHLPSTSPAKTSVFVLCIYVIWNLFFAWIVNRVLKREQQVHTNAHKITYSRCEGNFS